MVFRVLLVFLLAVTLIDSARQKKQKKEKKIHVKSVELDFDVPEVVAAEPTAMVELEGGEFDFGSEFHFDGDKVTSPKVLDGARPRRKVTVRPFKIDEEVVTNAQFARFVIETEYVTEAENFGWSFVFQGTASPLVARECDQNMGRVKDAPHWLAVKKASWAHPNGPDSSFNQALQLPVVQVSHNDAMAYCQHVGKRLPTEREWEFAARGGLKKVKYHWGDKHEKASFKLYNGWQGKFPFENTADDGYTGLSPVKSFPPNKYGIYGTLGNVWEWVAGTAEGDSYLRRKGGKLSAKEKAALADQRVLRGGSFVDTHDGNFNHIISVSTRQENSVDSGANNVGFRCAASATPARVKGEL